MAVRSTKQLPLFSVASRTPAKRSPLDRESERLLESFRRARLIEGAHPRSAAREVSQLRSLAREGGTLPDPLPLATLFCDLSRLAQVLIEPGSRIARSTGRARLVAAQRFIRLVGPALGRDAAADLDVLDTLLPAATSVGWHAAGTLVAGDRTRRRPIGPTLDGADLMRIVDQAAEGLSGLRRARDRALVSLFCFSGLRPEEVVDLRWEDLELTRTAAGYHGFTALVERRGTHLRLFIPGPGMAALRALAELLGAEMSSLSGPVFRAQGRTGRPLSYRSARVMLTAACRRAGYPVIEAVELRAGFASWLRAQGLSDHEVAEVLGLARVRSVDGLLRRHAALGAQRTVRERIER